ncbi:MAG: hypothetical protein F4W92_04365, partial [Gammaproteobacteria bacterium]|nr:hypothetical protein [Gammaproteobacteria bacterium]
MARLSSSKIRWSTGFIVFFLLLVLIVSLSASGAVQHIDSDSTDSRSESVPSDQQAIPLLLKTASIGDLFSNFSNGVSRLRAAYDLIGGADEARLINLFDQATRRKYAPAEASSIAELISLISTRLAGMNLDQT